MSERFFVEGPIDASRVTLSGPEAHHLIHVMRAHVGDRVVLFDGSGKEYEASVADLSRSAAELSVEAGREVDRELPFRLTLGVALPKGDRQRWLAEKAVELGVYELVLLKTERSVTSSWPSVQKRLHRTVVEASKQCRRNRLLQISGPVTWVDFVTRAVEKETCLMAHPGSASIGTLPRGDYCVAIGPEGGLTDEEVTLANDHGWKSVGLGPRVLRIETAALALSARIALGR
jgi:16S rRNA (uracil1498-N3)-methyltransferase